MQAFLTAVYDAITYVLKVVLVYTRTYMWSSLHVQVLLKTQQSVTQLYDDALHPISMLQGGC